MGAGSAAVRLVALAVTVGALVEEQLIEHLLYSYNKVARPVTNTSELLTVKFGASLIRIIRVDEKNQVMTTNLWLEMEWTDANLMWSPKRYPNITKLHIPSDLIWTPDIVLYNNAAGHPDIRIYSDALVYYDGTVIWKPPAIYKSFCPIDVKWFPYDSQSCKMKFGTWTYTGFYVDMRQLPEEKVITTTDAEGKNIQYIEEGMDLSYFYRSAEWDLLRLNSSRHEKIYSSCCGPEKYVDITYEFSLRRKTLFFTCNLIVPCFLISILTMFVFYLSDHKITLAISMLVTLTVFFLVLIDIIPPTSVVMPMFARYLMTTMILVTLSIMISVVSVNFHFRMGSTHSMPPWIRSVFLNWLPRLLMMERHETPADRADSPSDSDRSSMDPVMAPDGYLRVPTAIERRMSMRVGPPAPILRGHRTRHSPPPASKANGALDAELRSQKQLVERLLEHVRFIADHFRAAAEEEQISSDWTYVAMVMDRLFLIIFSFLNAGTLLIILQAPTLYDTREPLPHVLRPTKPLGQGCLPNANARLLPECGI